ncbi:MAG: TVP38/TMEM64 family protein [Deltaproteobacteria bacterium]|nr:TVP38/TMEM64 family protein [Deltaproteobacteria bacterium]
MTKAQTQSRCGLLVRPILWVSIFVGMAAAWQWTPLSTHINLEIIAAWEGWVKDHVAAPYIVVAAYLLGGFIFFPVTILTFATVLTFGPLLGNLYALAGWLLSATAGFGIGYLGRSQFERLAGSPLDRLKLDTRRNALLAVLTARVLPIAPFMLVNLFIGASCIRFRDFMLGSLLGRAPGLLALTLVGYQFETVMRAPAKEKFVLFAVMVTFLLLAYRWFTQQFRQRLVIQVDGGEPREIRVNPTVSL